jgi:hypothetical protein
MILHQTPGVIVIAGTPGVWTELRYLDTVALGGNTSRMRYILSPDATPIESESAIWTVGKNILLLHGLISTGYQLSSGCSKRPTTTGLETFTKTLYLAPLDNTYTPIVGAYLAQFDFTITTTLTSGGGIYHTLNTTQSVVVTKFDYSGTFFGIGREYYYETSGAYMKNSATTSKLSLTNPSVSVESPT